MKDTTILFRVDSELKEKATQIAKESKLDLSKLLTGYLIDTVRRGKVPINIKAFAGQYFEKENSFSIPFIKAKLFEMIKKQNYENKIEKIVLFGSYARGEANGDSDLDFRIYLTEECKGWDIGNIYMDLKETFNKEIDLVAAEDKQLSKEFLNNIKKDGIVIYGKA